MSCKSSAFPEPSFLRQLHPGKLPLQPRVRRRQRLHPPQRILLSVPPGVVKERLRPGGVHYLPQQHLLLRGERSLPAVRGRSLVAARERHRGKLHVRTRELHQLYRGGEPCAPSPTPSTLDP